MNVVFTGPAYDGHGNAILRADLVIAAQAKGHTVFPSIHRGAELVVASRIDTVKARKAVEWGVPVLDYPAFIAQLGPVMPAANSREKPDPFADTHAANKPSMDGDEL